MNRYEQSMKLGLLLGLAVACGQAKKHSESISSQAKTEVSDVQESKVTPPSSADPLPKADTPAKTPSGTSVPPVVQPSTRVDSAFVSSFLDKIAGESAAGRFTGSPQNKMVADLIAKEFLDAGLTPGGGNQTYFQTFMVSGMTATPVQTQNIIGVLPGKGPSNDVIIVGAHMDHLGVRNGQTYFGADDNASGTAALVAAAKALAQVKDTLQRTVVFIAFSAEELGLLGSQHYVKNPSFPLNQIKFMLNMDMVGYSKGNLDAIGFGQTLEGDRIIKDLIAKSGLIPKYYASTAGGSDHMPFAQLKIPTGVFHSGLHANYHQPSDSLEKIDRINLSKIAGLTADFAWSLAQALAINLRPLAMEPASYHELRAPLHSEGCSPEFTSFETWEPSF